MKPWRLSLLVLALATVVALGAFVLSVAASPGGGREVVVGLYQNPPKVYLDGAGRPAGLFVELLDAIAKKEGWKLRYRRCDWDQCLALLEQGRLDLMPDVAFSVERARRYDFHSVSVVSQWSQIYCSPRLRLLSLADLAGRRVAVLKSGLQQSYFDQAMASAGLSYRPVLVSSLDQGFSAVIAGEADAVASNSLFAAFNSRRFPLRETPVVFQPSSLYFAAAKGRNAELLRAIDARLSAWRSDADSVYFDALHRAMAAPPEVRAPHWVLWSLIALGCVLPLLLGHNLLLRRLVEQRTRALTETTRRMEAQQASLEHLAHYDTLTDLPNRALFFEHVAQGLAEARRNASRLALMFIDLDRFKPINDSFGHAVGDRVLQEAARRMSGCVRASDTVGRIGGDEFIVLLRDVGGDDDAVRVAEKIRAALGEPIVVAGNVLGISASIGIALYPEHGEEANEIAKRADDAMYWAKDSGRNRVVVFDPLLAPREPGAAA